MADWREALLAKGGTEAYAALSASRVRRIVEDCGLVNSGYVSASNVQTFLAGLQEDKRKPNEKTDQKADVKVEEKIKRGISAATFNYYLRDARSFFRWMVRDGRTMENPLEHLQGVNVRTDRRHDRRALSADELCWLRRVCVLVNCVA